MPLVTKPGQPTLERRELERPELERLDQVRLGLSRAHLFASPERLPTGGNTTGYHRREGVAPAIGPTQRLSLPSLTRHFSTPSRWLLNRPVKPVKPGD